MTIDRARARLKEIVGMLGVSGLRSPSRVRPGRCALRSFGGLERSCRGSSHTHPTRGAAK